MHPSFGQEEATRAEETDIDASELIIHHVLDDHIWHLWDHGGTIYLPVIVYSSEKGLDIFSSHHFYDEHHNVVEYDGYKLDHEHIYLAAIGQSGPGPFDHQKRGNVAYQCHFAASGLSCGSERI